MVHLLRSYFFTLIFYSATALFVTLGSPLLLGPRSWAMAGLRAHARTCLWLLKHIIGTKYEIRNQHHIPQGAVIAASKHHSTWETFALIPLFSDPTTIQKAELFHLPFHGWFSRKFGMIGIKRETGPSALRYMLKQAHDRVSVGRQILIFPEGTRKKVGAPPDYKSGVAKLYEELNVPCVPIALNSSLYWPRHSPLKYPGTILVEVLEPIAPGLPRKQFMALLQERIETATKRLVDEAYNEEKST